MALPKIQDQLQFTDAEIESEILALKRKLFELRLQKATRREVKSHQFKHIRHQLAQLMTIERQRQLSGPMSTTPSLPEKE
jgi:large subunit ribosomal protein L29